MYYSSLESSHRDGSIGGKIASLALIDGELRLPERTCDISPSNDDRILKRSSLESPHLGDSNGGKIMFLESLDREIFELKNAFSFLC